MTFVLAAQAARQPTVPVIAASAVSSSAIQISLITPSVEPVNGIAFYILSRRVGAGAFVPVQNVSPGAFPFTDAGLLPSTSYTYNVEGVNNSANRDTSNASVAVSATTQGPSAPETPTTPVISAAPLSSASIRVSLTTPSSAPIFGVNHYVLQRSVGGSAFNTIASLTPAQWPYNDTGLSSSTTYSYRTFAVDNDGPATPSATSQVTAATTQGGGQGAFGIKNFGGKWVSTLDGSTIVPIGSAVVSLEETQNRGSRWPGVAAVTSSQYIAARDQWANSLSAAARPYGTINMIRVPICSFSWMGYTGVDCFGGGAANFTAAAGGLFKGDGAGVYRGLVQQTVANILGAGMYPLLDMHWGTPVLTSTGQNVISCGQTAFISTADAIAWTSLAQTFGYPNGTAGSPAIIFESMNEPYGDNIFNDQVGSIEVAILGGRNVVAFPSPATQGGGYLMLNNVASNSPTGIVGGNRQGQTTGHQANVDAIRATGATNPIVCSPNNYAGEIQTWMQMGITDPLDQLGAAFHGYGYRGGFGNFQTIQNAGHPIIATELGTLANIPSTYKQFYDNGMGYCWWSWYNFGSSANLYTSSMSVSAPWSKNGAPAPNGNN